MGRIYQGALRGSSHWAHWDPLPQRDILLVHRITHPICPCSLSRHLILLRARALALVRALALAPLLAHRLTRVRSGPIPLLHRLVPYQTLARRSDSAQDSHPRQELQDRAGNLH